MTSRRGLAAALLLAAVPARAQFEVRTAPAAAYALPALPPVLTAASARGLGSPSLASAPSLLAPSALAALIAPAAAVAAPAAAAPSAPAPALISAALDDFAQANVAKAAPDRASEAGETLMLRALGAAAPAETAASEEPASAFAAAPTARLAPPGASARRRVYLLTRPLRERVELGPLTLAAHAVYAVAWEVAKAWLGWKAGGWAGAGAVTVVELPFAPFMAGGRTLAHLGLRYWRRKLAVLREIALVPAVERVRVLTSGETKFFGPLARSRDNTGLIFVDAAGEVPAEFGRFGAPLPLGDLSARVRLTFVQNGTSAAVLWTPTLGELLEGRPIPAAVAAAWRAAVKAETFKNNPAARALGVALDAAREVAHGSPPSLGEAVDAAREVARGGAPRLEASISGPAGEQALGAVAEGPALMKLIGLGRLDRVRAFLRRPLPARSIRITDAAVERAGAAPASGVGARLSRAWRRLRGRLIVAP